MMNLVKYKQIFREFAEEAEFIDKNIKKLNLNKDSKILDIGTGMGAMSTLLALNGFKVLTGEPEVDPERENMGNHKHHHHDKLHESNQCKKPEDYDWDSWNDWRDSAKKLGVENKIKFQNFDAQNLPFEEKSFDGIFLYDALQHIQNRELALKECLRILNDDGKIVVIEWSKNQIEKDYKKYGYKIDFIDPKEYLKKEDISMEVSKGESINFYILRKA
jgi:ubiquinone/menaquinone biosynthesis C-methylase UbiE